MSISRCLEGKTANDTRLADVLARAYPRRITKFTIKAAAPSALNNSPGITDSGLELLAHACPGLKTLVLFNCVQLKDEGLEAISKVCNELEKLELSHLPHIGDRGLKAIASRCNMLSKLILDSCPLIQTGSFLALANPNSRMRSLSVVKCPQVPGVCITSLISILPELAKLKLGHMELDDAALRAIGEDGRKLRKLWLEGIHGRSAEICCSWIGMAPQLESLTLKSCTGLTFIGLEENNHPRFIGLKSVFIKNFTSLGDEGLLELSKSSTRMVDLTLESCGQLTRRGLMQALSNWCRTLKMLSLTDCDIISDTTENSLEAGLIEELKLTKCGGVGDDFLSWISGACRGHLKHVELVGMGEAITDKGVYDLLKAEEGLESLDLSGCWHLTCDILSLVLAPNGAVLETLRLERCIGLNELLIDMIVEFCSGLRELDLSRCDIRDEDVITLANSMPPRLRFLSLADCAWITNQSLEILAMRSNGRLLGLNLKGCPGFTELGITWIRGALVGCEVIA